ncbi:hypothetical protein PCA01_02530 [Pseudoalteromonas carrageenovora]|nr:hypothetical protein PCA01_02530 [Pseudoalteromonas carrageenovora]
MLEKSGLGGGLSPPLAATLAEKATDNNVTAAKIEKFFIVVALRKILIRVYLYITLENSKQCANNKEVKINSVFIMLFLP